jgi:outer membrane protein OmpA-like peptidoglycan-associated protein
MTPKRFTLVCLALLCATAPAAWGQDKVEPFSKRVGDVKVSDVAPLPETGAFEMPFILWGGDVATFHANGGISTKDGSIFHKQGLNLKLVPGDDFPQQVKDYVEGRSAFLRGTLGMIALASEVVGSDERIKPVVFLQMTWSKGDHMVGRGFKTDTPVNELKGKTICLQSDGPHVGMLGDILTTAGLKWSDIKVVWVKDISGADGPAEKFKGDEKIDACFVITPDMEGLTGGRNKVGTGAGGTVKDARVLVSTDAATNSIADVYACRKDFYDKNKPLIQKFTAGYLKAVEDVKAMMPGKDNKPPGDPKAFAELCKLAVEVYGKNPKNKEAVADEAAAAGLIGDAIFTGLQDNFIFFSKEKVDPTNFVGRMKTALDLATEQGYAGKRIEMLAHDMNFADLKKMAALKEETTFDKPPKFGEGEVAKKKKQPIASFTISFEPDQDEFKAEQYAAAFQKAIEQAKVYGNAVIDIRGHADGTNLVAAIVSEGIGKGVFKDAGGGKYTLKDGTPLDLKDVNKLVEIGVKEGFPSASDFKTAVTSLQNLSDKRAAKVRGSVLGFAKDKGLSVDQSQLTITGVGVGEPASMVVPRDKAEQAKNRRVEFRLSSLVDE